jgi:hypothetical protein
LERMLAAITTELKLFCVCLAGSIIGLGGVGG